MRNRRFVQSTVLAAAMAVASLGAGAGIARADQITLEVSGALTANLDSGASCSSAGCTLGGTLVINNSAGAANNGLVSADITVSGESPSASPFTHFFSVASYTGLTQITVDDASGDILNLYFATPTAGSLDGYDGGSLSTVTEVGTPSDAEPLWTLTSGSLTPPATTPTVEPASFLLFGTGLIGLAALLHRRSRREKEAARCPQSANG